MSEATGNYHKLDSVAYSRSLGQPRPTKVSPPSPQSVQIAQASSEASPARPAGPWSRAIRGDVESSPTPPQEQTIRLAPKVRPNVGETDSPEQIRYNKWRRAREKAGLSID